MNRANFIGAPEYYELNQACRTITEAYGYCVFLVGSSMHKRDYRDVDVRCILQDSEFERMFPGLTDGAKATHAGWSLLCSSISLWLSKHTGLKIDFQFQQMTQANKEYPSEPRSALGVFCDHVVAVSRKVRDQ